MSVVDQNKNQDKMSKNVSSGENVAIVKVDIVKGMSSDESLREPKNIHHEKEKEIIKGNYIEEEGDGEMEMDEEEEEFGTEDEESDLEEEECSDSENSEEDEEAHKKAAAEWNQEQEELLESALSSFSFLPRTTVDKLLSELVQQGCSKVTKAQVRAWFLARVPWLGGEGPSRWETRARNLLISPMAVHSQRQSSRVTFAKNLLGEK